MRLWHKHLLVYLPREQLISQWQECSTIADAIIKNGTPNHKLVNYIMDYPIEHFVWYSMRVRLEMTKREYKTSQAITDKIWSLLPDPSVKVITLYSEDLFKNHHDKTYFKICLWNLYEKQIRGILSENNLPFDYLIE